ncbi:kynurenine 3-monooxygenase [Lentithecium fluviatile CBS 122367]|uniref:Kynurenine 3-monooxygenase n=1 Tax=Lentithecium fluviatile CBS 122367 TaxID=1168545 RepID=A0A6G1J836_9PLEO|nr:kynurenine 3-monooxygenase [Lentithecium fluviatile CBS 122367]
MTLTAPPTHVAIIGGGLAGFTLALALQGLNIPSNVYEGRSEDYDQGGGVLLSPNALRVLDSVGVYQRVRERGYNLDILAFKDADGNTTDEYYFGSEKLYDYPAVRIMRKELLDELRAMLRERNVPVHYNYKLASVVDRPDEVEFAFENGQTASAPLVIGADGIHSTVRKSFLPQVKPMYAGFLGINCIVEKEQLRIPEDYHLPVTVMAKPGAFLLVPQGSDGSHLFVGSQRRFAELDQAGWDALRKDKAKLYDMLQENKDDWPDVVQSALEAISVDGMNFWAFYGIPPLASWLSDTKRIILVGDAAHAIPPTVAQGANQAFEDVRSLATILSRLSEKVPLDKAAARWQSYRQARIDKVLELTKQMTVKRLPEAERAKLPPGVFWNDQSLTQGGGGELRWLYEPDLAEEAEKWVQELEVTT